MGEEEEGFIYHNGMLVGVSPNIRNIHLLQLSASSLFWPLLPKYTNLFKGPFTMNNLLQCGSFLAKQRGFVVL